NIFLRPPRHQLENIHLTLALIYRSPLFRIASEMSRRSGEGDRSDPMSRRRHGGQAGLLARNLNARRMARGSDIPRCRFHAPRLRTTAATPASGDPISR